jgi:hypothetical protein
MQNFLMDTLEAARQSTAYQNYLSVRGQVLAMLEEAAQLGDLSSNYWQEELAGFSYMLDASPLIVARLREHCYHLTGLRSYDYRQHHKHQQDGFVRKLAALRRQDSDDLFVPESPLLGGFGYKIGDGLVNVDTLKFYEALIALNRGGLLSQFRRPGNPRKIVLEIGAGWGGFAYQFKTLCPDVCYVIVDLPQTLLFSAVYLKTLFPQATILVYGDRPDADLMANCRVADFVFLPNFFLDRLDLPALDLAINMVSFQEMTTDQVTGYVRKIYDLGCPNVYSLNRDRSAHNTQLTTVSSILEQYYQLAEVEVLDIAYGAMPPPEPAGNWRQALKLARALIQRRPQRTIHDYRHLIGARTFGV